MYPSKKYLFILVGLAMMTISCESEENKEKREVLEKVMGEYDKYKVEYEEKKKKHKVFIPKEQPKEPGPMGIFSPTSIGMTLTEALVAQPGFQMEVGNGPGASYTFDGTLVEKKGYAFFGDEGKRKNAFPWKWGKDINANVFVSVLGPVTVEQKKVNFSSGEKIIDISKHLPNESIVMGYEIDYFDDDKTFSASVDAMKKIWGDPKTLTLDDSTHIVWRNDKEKTCVVFRKSIFVNRPSRRLVIGNCLTPDEFIAQILIPPTDKNAIVGAKVDSLAKHLKYNIRRSNPDRMTPSEGWVDLPIFFHNPNNNDLNQNVTVHSSDGVISKIECKAFFGENVIVTSSGQKVIPVQEALANALRKHVPEDVLAVAKNKTVSHKLESGLILELYLGSSFKLALRSK